jgi:hypothetical protein
MSVHILRKRVVAGVLQQYVVPNLRLCKEMVASKPALEQMATEMDQFVEKHSTVDKYTAAVKAFDRSVCDSPQARARRPNIDVLELTFLLSWEWIWVWGGGGQVPSPRKSSLAGWLCVQIVTDSHGLTSRLQLRQQALTLLSFQRGCR